MGRRAGRIDGKPTCVYEKRIEDYGWCSTQPCLANGNN